MRLVAFIANLEAVAPLRILDPTGLYHVMSRGNYRQGIFPDDAHSSRYLSLLERVTVRRKLIVVDWCLMPNHVHLLIQLTDGGLSEGMRELNGCYSRWSNSVRQLTGTGHLVRNRFKAIPVTTDSYLLALLRYIPMNPVQAELVDAPAAWTLSGFRATAGLEHPRPFHRPDHALRCFSNDPQKARRLYRRHVATEPVGDGLDPWSDDGLEP
jgi:putative transposase